MAYNHVKKIEVNGIESKLSISTVFDDKLNEMQAHIYFPNNNIYLNQEQLDKLIYLLSNLNLQI